MRSVALRTNWEDLLLQQLFFCHKQKIEYSKKDLVAELKEVEAMAMVLKISGI